MKDNVYYGINSQNEMNKYINPDKVSNQDVLNFLEFCLEKEVAKRAFNPISSDLLLYFEMLYKNDEEIQKRVKILKEQLFNQMIAKKKLYTSIVHTDEQYDNARRYIFGDKGITIYNSMLRQLLREVRDNKQILL